MRHLVSTAAMLALAAAAPLMAETPAKIQAAGVTFSRQSVTASGITPHGRAILFGLQRAHISYTNVTMKFALLQTDQNGGTVTWQLKEDPLPFSIWAVIDVETGNVRFSKPDDTYTPLVRFSNVVPPPKSLRAVAGSSHVSRLVLPAQNADVIWVRPGKGAWRADLFDGGGSDADHESDGQVSIDASTMQAIDLSGPPPTEFAPGDVIVAIDSRNLRYFSLEVPK